MEKKTRLPLNSAFVHNNVVGWWKIMAIGLISGPRSRALYYCVDPKANWHNSSNNNNTHRDNIITITNMILRAFVSSIFPFDNRFQYQYGRIFWMCVVNNASNTFIFIMTHTSTSHTHIDRSAYFDGALLSLAFNYLQNFPAMLHSSKRQKAAPINWLCDGI